MSTYDWTLFLNRIGDPEVILETKTLLAFVFADCVIEVDKGVDDKVAASLENVLSTAHRVNMLEWKVSKDTLKLHYNVEEAGHASVCDLLSSRRIPRYLSVVSILTISFQTAVLAAVAHSICSEYKAVTISSLDLAICRLFISAFLGLYISGSLSVSTTRLMVSKVPLWRSHRATQYVAAVVALPIMIIIAGVLWIFQNTGAHLLQCDALNLIEFARAVTAIVATGFIIKQQSSSVDCIIMFITVVLILRFDELVSKAIAFQLKAVQASNAQAAPYN
jgi:hypothetical protein